MAILGEDFSEQDAKQALITLDQDASGQISFQEYLNWFYSYDVRKVFMQFDKDKTGSIDAEELRHVCKHLGLLMTDASLHDAVKSLDKNGSGSISFDEFWPWWSVMKERQANHRFHVRQQNSSWEESVFHIGNQEIPLGDVHPLDTVQEAEKP